MNTTAAAKMTSPMAATEMRETLRQMLNDWEAASDEERAAALAAVA